MTSAGRIVIGVVALLAVATGIFALRSWVGLEPARETAAPGVTADRRTPSPTLDVEPTPSPSATTPSPSPSTPAPPTASTAPTATAPTSRPATTMSTGEVEQAIRTRTGSVAGRGTVVSCPSTVSASIGTRFRCTVAFADAPGRVVSDATVVVNGPGGRFVWESRTRD